VAAPSAAGSNPQKFAERTVVITRVFDAPRSLVFKAWTDKDQLKEWWGPKHFTNPVCEVDARVGGAWHIVMRDPQGNDYPCNGVYREIVEPERLVFTNNATDADGNVILEGLTKVTFVERNGKTTVTVDTTAAAMVSYAAAFLEGMEAGWTQSIDKLSALFAKS
jgi:uncharacterized protein YndB with AHSA1/START domain